VGGRAGYRFRSSYCCTNGVRNNNMMRVAAMNKKNPYIAQIHECLLRCEAEGMTLTDVIAILEHQNPELCETDDEEDEGLIQTNERIEV